MARRGRGRQQGRWFGGDTARDGGGERRAARLAQPERIGEGTDRVGVGALALPTLQRADRVRRKPGTLGQLLLREPRPFAVAAQYISEGHLLHHRSAASMRPSETMVTQPNKSALRDQVGRRGSGTHDHRLLQRAADALAAESGE